GEVEVTVRDQNGQTAVARVHVVPIPKSAKEVVLKNLNFDFDTDRLTKSSRKELDRNIAEIADVKIRKIIVVGHTDSKGSDAYNQDLSQQRAETVAKILRTRFNLRTDQVDAVGYGESQPIATNETDAGRLQNRRCELKLYYAD
ncbi:MAG: OmpA family protein, partial [Proteobacteria bacterium]